jgi:hypothetical protein
LCPVSEIVNIWDVIGEILEGGQLVIINFFSESVILFGIDLVVLNNILGEGWVAIYNGRNG